MAPVLLEVPASSLAGFSIKIRCGPHGTRFPIISPVSSSSEETSTSNNASTLLSSESPMEDFQTGDSLNRALHLSFDDDAQGAFLKLSFTPAPESRGQERFLSPSSTSLPWGNPSTPTFSSSLANSQLWNTTDHIPHQTICQDNGSLSEHMSSEPPLNQAPEFDLRLEDIHGINPISPFPNNTDELNSLMSILSRNTVYPSSSITSTIPSNSQGNSVLSASSTDITMNSSSSRGTSSVTSSRRGSESSTPSQTTTPSPSDAGDSDFTSTGKENPLSHPYSCPHAGCNRKFKREYNLSLHIRTHEPRPKKRFACAFPECNRLKFSRKHDLFRHICNIHSDTASWTCDWCASEFPNSEALVAHIRLHYENEAGGYKSPS